MLRETFFGQFFLIDMDKARKKIQIFLTVILPPTTTVNQPEQVPGCRGEFIHFSEEVVKNKTQF